MASRSKTSFPANDTSATGFEAMLAVDHAATIDSFLYESIIRWEATKDKATVKTILGYEILPNTYFYHYQAPVPANEFLAELWRLEKEAEKMLEGLAK